MCVCVCVLLLQERERGEANGPAHAAERQLPRQRWPQGTSSSGPRGDPAGFWRFLSVFIFGLISKESAECWRFSLLSCRRSGRGDLEGLKFGSITPHLAHFSQPALGFLVEPLKSKTKEGLFDIPGLMKCV